MFLEIAISCLLVVSFTEGVPRKVKQYDYKAEGSYGSLAENASPKRNLFEDIIEETVFTEDNIMDKVKFMLYTRKNPTTFQLLGLNVSSLHEATNFDLKKDVKIVIPGWRTTYLSPFPMNIKNAFLTKYDSNIVIVDWSPLTHLLYPKSRSSVPSVGKVVAKFINLLFDHGIQPSKFHVIGHSLGAHVAGIAGLNVRHLLPRVTGLDPAGPMFTIHESERLSNSSAAFVDVIHTCGLMLGFFQPLGHVDFYPNRGTPIQPGCGVDWDGICSHRRAYIFYIESILSSGIFMAKPCSNWNLFQHGDCPNVFVEMGESTPSSARGVFYLKTAAKYPFGIGRN